MTVAAAVMSAPHTGFLAPRDEIDRYLDPRRRDFDAKRDSARAGGSDVLST
jgi:hypothetical protein